MTTADRIDPLGYRSWAPSQSAVLDDSADSAYAGKHRRPGMRSFSLLRMFYTPRHRAG